MIKKNVAILAGGYSTEWEISMQSAEIVLNHLDRDQYNPYILEIKKEGWKVLAGDRKVALDLSAFAFIHNGTLIQFDVAFNAIHGNPGENGLIQGYLESRGIPHTSCNQFVSALTFNKWHCNTVLKTMGFTCADSILVEKGEEIDKKEIINCLGLPLFVKPNQAGSSFGVSKVKEDSDLLPALEEAFREDNFAIIEAFMQGIELACGVYKSKGEIISLTPTEIRSENDFFDYEAKYLGKSEEITPANISPEITLKVRETSKQVYKKLNCAGIVRVDFILVNNILHIIEVNTVPGLTKESIVPKQVKYYGSDLQSFFGLLLNEVV